MKGENIHLSVEQHSTVSRTSAPLEFLTLSTEYCLRARSVSEHGGQTS